MGSIVIIIDYNVGLIIIITYSNIVGSIMINNNNNYDVSLIVILFHHTTWESTRDTLPLSATNQKW